METCLGFNIECGTLAKGAGVTIMGFILFVGSVYLILTAVLGRWLGYLVLMVSFSGWMIMLSALWAFGFYSQGPDTVNLGPRGAEPTWIPLLASTNETSDAYEPFARYPQPPWEVPGPGEEVAEVQSVSGIVTDFLASQANEEADVAETDPRAITGVDFAVNSIAFAEDGDVPLAVVKRTPRGRAPVDRVAVPRRGQRPPLLLHVPGRLGDPVPDPSPVARRRRAQAQGVPHRRLGAALVRARLMVREEVGALLAQAHDVPLLDQGASSSSCSA